MDESDELYWGNARPTAPGFWWYRRVKDGVIRDDIFRITALDIAANDSFPTSPDAYWAGPIKYPVRYKV